MSEPLSKMASVQRPPLESPGGVSVCAERKTVGLWSQGLKSDAVKFGMERDCNAGCCITRFLGGESGCCAGIKSGKPFEKEYIAAIEKSIDKTGEMPKLDSRVRLKLEEMDALKPLEALAEKTQKPLLGQTKAPDRKNEPLWKKILLAPFRWLKAMFIGLWEDLKVIFRGKRSEPTS
ncbi:MAG: hypothetical protein VKJ04_03660 [Vampirovibrionales bacterium]|nr:hypothetical protein [Vampirovibrionales bacterium]